MIRPTQTNTTFFIADVYNITRLEVFSDYIEIDDRHFQIDTNDTDYNATVLNFSANIRVVMLRNSTPSFNSSFLIGGFNLTAGYIVRVHLNDTVKFRKIPNSAGFINFTLNGSVISNSPTKLTLNWTLRTYNITLIDEMTGKCFQHNFTDIESAKMSFFCQDQTLEFAVTNCTGQSFITSCVPETIRLQVNFTNELGSYWRTLVPVNEYNLTFYMADLTDYSVVKINLYKKDVTGSFDGSYLKVKKVVDESNVEIIEQYFDAEDKTILYLILDESYTLQVVGRTETRSLGYLVADVAGNKDVWIADIPLIPPGDSLFVDVNWYFNATAGSRIIRFVYEDILEQTNYVKFWIWNGTNTSQLIFYDDINGTSNVVFTYNVPAANVNETFLLEFEASHQKYGIIRETAVSTQWSSDTWFVDAVSAEWKAGMAMFIIIITALAIGAWNAHISAVIVSVEAGLFYLIGMLPIEMSLVIITCIVLAVIAALAKGGKRP